jgi:hypothetical protein
VEKEAPEMNPVTHPFLQLPLFSTDAGAGKNCRVKEPPTPSRFSRGARHLLDLLRWYGSRFRGQIYPTQAKLGGHLKVSLSTVRRWLRELKEIGAVFVRKYGRQAAEYELKKAILNQIDAAENERSTNCQRTIGDQSIATKNGASFSASSDVHLPHTACASKKQTETQAPRPQAERKLPEKFERALAMLKAQGYK